MNRKTMFFGIFSLVAIAVGFSLALASVEPFQGGQSVLKENVAEIHSAKMKDLQFDQDLSTLSRYEARYRQGGQFVPREQSAQAPRRSSSQRR